MKCTKYQKTSILLFVGISFLFSGCSIIGLGIGTAVDASRSKMDSFGANEVSKINNKSKIVVHKKDSTLVSGKLVGTSQISQQNYDEAYKKFLKHDHVQISELFPDIGDSLEIIYKDPHHFESYGLFVGFDHNNILYSNYKGDRIFQVSYDTLYTSIKYKENELDFIYIKGLINHGRIPTLLEINLLFEDIKTIQIPANEIDKILTKNKRNGKIIGFSAGLVIDAIIVVIGIKGMQNISISL